MKCDYGDGLKVDFSGSLRISKSEEVKLIVEGRSIPSTIMGALQSASRNNSCAELRRAAWKLAFARDSA